MFRNAHWSKAQEITSESVSGRLAQPVTVHLNNGLSMAIKEKAREIITVALFTIYTIPGALCVLEYLHIYNINSVFLISLGYY